MVKLLWTAVTAMWRQDRAVMLARVHSPFSSVAMLRLTAVAPAQAMHPEGKALGILAGSSKRLAGGGINAVCAIEFPESVRAKGAAIACRMLTTYERTLVHLRAVGTPGCGR